MEQGAGSREHGAWSKEQGVISFMYPISITVPLVVNKCNYDLVEAKGQKQT